MLLLEDSAECGDVVHVETAAGRVESGVLLEEKPHYTHSYGDFVPEIIEIDNRLRKIMAEVKDNGCIKRVSCCYGKIGRNHEKRPWD